MVSDRKLGRQLRVMGRSEPPELTEIQTLINELERHIRHLENGQAT
jgi:hypothetical protein